jgi:HEAT repeat protein
VLDVRNHSVTGLRSYVGGRWRVANGVTDLGNVSAQSAANYLVALAKQAPASVGHKAIFPATLGDSVTIWPSLMQIARDAAIPNETRRDAVFWLGQMAGNAVTANLAQLAAEDTVDRAVRESAVFALSQRPKDEGVPALIHVAQTNRDPAVRKRALFWLGQSNDPRALSLFESILTGNGKS